MITLKQEPPKEMASEQDKNDIAKLSIDRREGSRVFASERWRIRIVGSDLPPEICTTNNVSRCGLYFVTTSTHYTPGMRLCVIRNFDPARGTTAEEMGEVLRVDLLMDGRVGVAIRIQKDK
jgi:hypothetical protein